MKIYKTTSDTNSRYSIDMPLFHNSNEDSDNAAGRGSLREHAQRARLTL